MPLHDLDAWMWAKACAMLDRADRLHRQFFRPIDLQSRPPVWEPPVDIYQTHHQIDIVIALPGVAPEQLEILQDGSCLLVRGKRLLSVEAGVEIRRLEIPYGRFERRIELPTPHYEVISQRLSHGCLLLTLYEQEGLGEH